MSGVYFNEIDPFKAEYLRVLIREGVIADGEVDERSIEQVESGDVKGFTQCHFFAGIGVWSYALRIAGWSDDRPVWTGSCPCPSFSAAGKGEGFEDPRHLWPSSWFRLIRECRPATIIGEQVDAAIGHGWLDLVQSDLEAEAYAVGKAVLGACSVGAPHRRQRLYFVADTQCRAAERWGFGVGAASGEIESRAQEWKRLRPDAGHGLATRSPADAEHAERRPVMLDREDGCDGKDGGWLDPLSARSASEAGATRGFWRDCDWWYGRDGKYRPIGRGISPIVAGKSKSSVLALAAGTSGDLRPLRDCGEREPESAEARVQRLRAYGDCIVPQVAQAFIEAYLEIEATGRRE